jgi:CxC2 like cysteine cluster associated with KDZ transposases
MGHGGAPCPSAGDGTDIWEDTELVHDDTDKHTDGNIPELVEDNSQTSKLVIVHSSGIFYHHVCWCGCVGASPPHLQLFKRGLFPASLAAPKTAFTFDVLDHFYMDSMECKTAAMSFCQKLQCFTDNALPGRVPVSNSATLPSK